MSRSKKTVGHVSVNTEQLRLFDSSCCLLIDAEKKDKNRRKGKGRRFCLGEDIQFLAALAVLPRTILKNRMNSTRMI